MATASNAYINSLGVLNYGFELIISVIIGLVTGVVSSFLVTEKYRKKDAEREKHEFVVNMRCHISLTRRALLQLNFFNNDDNKIDEYINELEDIIYNPPIFKDYFVVSQEEKKAYDMYKLCAQNVEIQLRKYQKAQDSLNMAKRIKYVDEVAKYKTEEDKRGAVQELRYLASDWTELSNCWKELIL